MRRSVLSKFFGIGLFSLPTPASKIIQQSALRILEHDEFHSNTDEHSKKSLSSFCKILFRNKVTLLYSDFVGM